MSLTKSIVLLPAFLILAVTAHAQTNRASAPNESSAVEVKDDRFGGGRVVMMRPTILLDDPGHRLTISAESKKRANEPGTGISEIDDRVTLGFVSLASTNIDFGDREVRFLVDGKPVDGGGRAAKRIFRGEDAGRPELTMGEKLITIVSLNKLKEISKGSKVELRLGSLEFVLSKEVLTNLRRFVAAAASSPSSSGQ